MTRNDESFKELNISIEAFERAGQARLQLMEREPETLPTSPSWRRRWRMLMRPAVIAGLALVASMLYLGLRYQVEPLPAPAVDRTDPAAVIDSTGAELVQTTGGHENVDLDATRQLADASESTRSVNGVVLDVSEHSDRDSVVATDAEAAVANTETEVSENGNILPVVSDGLQVETDAAVDAPQQGRYAIQVASVTNRGRATALAERLADAGYPSSVVESRQGADPTLFRVRIGTYPDRQAADAVGQRVEDEEALDWYVVTLR